MTSGDNRRAFLSSLLLAGGSVAAFRKSFQQNGRVDPPGPGDAMFEQIQLQMVALLRATRARGGFLVAEDAVRAAAFMRVCAVHARGLDLDRAARHALATRIAEVGQDAVLAAPKDLTPLRAALRRKGLVLDDSLVNQIAIGDATIRMAAMDALRRGQTTATCDRIAEALEAAAPRRPGRNQRFVRRVAAAAEARCSFLVGQWSMFLALAWYVGSFDDGIRQFVEAMWAGFILYDLLDRQQC